MTSTPGPADDAQVPQAPGVAETDLPSEPTGGGHEREVGVTAAVERGPAELTDEVDDLDEEPDSDADAEPARSTDDL